MDAPAPALVLVVIFLGLAALHMFWAFSSRAGLLGFVPTENGAPVFRPGRAATLGVAVLLTAAAGVALWRGVWPDAGASRVPRIGIALIAVVFAARAVGDFRFVGFFKRVRGTNFARKDSLVFTPLCVVISALAVWLAVAY